MTPLPRESLVVLAATGAGLAVTQTLRLWARGFATRRRLAVQSRRAIAGEARAEKLLAKAGYAIEARQAAGSWRVRVDGEEHDVSLRADFLVARRRKRYVAEVKTGEMAPEIAVPATRRQLLEYRCAFGVDGVLLVDAEAGRVHAVDFELPASPSKMPMSASLIAFLLGGVTAALIVLALWQR